MRREAAFQDKRDDRTVVCELCPTRCVLDGGQYGTCDSRYNEDGILYTDNYGELVTLALDPIEKKPLYHFYPGSGILSTGPNSCNLGCLHCQNWNISQERCATTYLSPEELARRANECDCVGIAFTYTEPLMWYEYILDVAPLLRANGQKVVLVTNGYLQPEPFENILGHADALNIDLKSMDERFYRRVCKGELQPVLDNIRQAVVSGTHVEITNLLIPNENDSPDQIKRLVKFVASLSPKIPVHFSAYRPDYKMDIPATPISSLKRAFELARTQLEYVYLGNVMLEEGADTICPSCGHLLIKRAGYRTSVVGLEGSKCAACDAETGVVTG